MKQIKENNTIFRNIKQQINNLVIILLFGGDNSNTLTSKQREQRRQLNYQM